VRHQRGFTLVETAVAVALLAVIVISILSAFSATTLAADRHAQLTTLDRVTRSDAEYIKSQAYSVKPAAYAHLAVAGYTFGYQVLYYDGSQPPASQWLSSNSDTGLQEIVLSVNGPNNASEQLDFLKVQP
jgi:prepilin-type N-terminal cleavage/methylation domain-containing protein